MTLFLLIETAMPELPHALAATVTEVKTDSVAVLFEDGQTLRWPKRLLPAEVKVGDRMHLVAIPDKETDAERRNLAKQVLNEMLRGT